MSFFTSGLPPVFGEPAGEAAGLGLDTGLEVATGVGLAGGFGGSGFDGSQAAVTAVAIASIDAKITDLLIVFS